MSDSSLLWLHEDDEPKFKNNGLLDYKFFCFDGEPQMMLACSGRAEGDLRFDFFDMDFNHLDIRQCGAKNADCPLVRPTHFDEMRDTARKLSAGFPHLRIDFYEVGGKTLFGEYTFYDSSGFGLFDPFEVDEQLGDMLCLPVIDEVKHG